MRSLINEFTNNKNLNIIEQKLELDCKIYLSVRKKEAEEKKAREDARGEMEERMKGIQGAAAAKGTNTEDISVGITSCSNTACKCTDCECGEKCTCGVSMEVTCDPCREFKFKKK